MANIVKYGVRPDTALTILKIIEAAGHAVDRQFIAGSAGLSLMTVGKAAEILVSGGAAVSFHGESGDSGRKPEVLSPSGALFAVIDLSGNAPETTLYSPSGDMISSYGMKDIGGCAGLFSFLLSICEDKKIIGSAVIVDSYDEDGSPFSYRFSDGNVLSAVSASLRAKIYYAGTRTSAASMVFMGKGKRLLLDADARPLPVSGLLSSDGLSPVGDISNALEPGASGRNIGEAAAFAALICGVDRLTILGGDDDIFNAAVELGKGRIETEKAGKIDILRVAAEKAVGNWLTEICAAARK